MYCIKLVDIVRIQTQLGTSVLDSAVLQTNFDFTFDFWDWHIKKGPTRTAAEENVKCQDFLWNTFNLFALRHFLVEEHIRDEDLVWVSSHTYDEITRRVTETQIEMHL